MIIPNSINCPLTQTHLIFHFLVGHEQSHLTVHTGIVRNLSPPLYVLINNGMMKDSIERSAILDDVEEGTFIGFCEFAYRGAYTTPDRRGEDNDGESGSFDGAKKEHQGRVHSELASDNPDAESSQRYAEQYASVAYGIPLSKVKTHETYVQYPYGGLWKQFRQLHFVGDEASISLTPDLVFHGKLYTQCLKSLHCDLCKFSLNKQNVPHILDLLEYTYQESGRGDPDIGCSLRDLVIHYAAFEARTLAENRRFGNILDRFSEMGSDLVRKIVNLGCTLY
ncbi:uncharacterized protein ASPGLDRAFT_75699 [Aspergillus glaucus CBS 516.65]|uniref:BTB domain-containing protein n=1 Tax=Aspergillus glaucus CBS 516.65 TaxID=1160497 RepID=A0A1L9VFF5_ASPGL|nr:hypothetical protein ASPGLDRAFT_75699 [Aspergillus glaucus CBS 516.65]OJJ82562.1 hypothetical protein ASPGLDRAFT_75699 [Aspergillus glaucus CBS 516.65]